MSRLGITLALALTVLCQPTGTFAAEPPTVALSLVSRYASCNPDQELIQINTSDKQYLLTINGLVTPPNLGWGGACRLFLNELRNDSNLREHPGTSISLVKEPVTTSDLSVIWRSPELDEICLSRGFCLRDLFDYWTVSPKITECAPEFNLWDLAKISLGRSTRTIKPLPSVQIELFPLTALADAATEIPAPQPAARPLITSSTMSLGDGTLHRMVNRLTRSGARTLLALDATVMFSNMSVERREQLCSNDSILPIPITRGAKLGGNYHIKGASLLGSSAGAITSMNLAAPSKVAYLELVYKFQGAQAAAELRTLILKKIQAQCERPPTELSCIARTFDAPEDFCQSATQRACSLLQNLPDELAGEHRREFFLDTATDDPRAFLESQLSQAKEEIVVVSHQLSDRRFIETLSRAKKRGVKVSVFSGEDNQSIELADIDWRGHWTADALLPAPHFKMVIIDGRRLIFSSGNFTKMALDYSDELFAIIEDQPSVDFALALAASYGVPTKNNLVVENQYVSFANTEDLSEFNREHSSLLGARGTTGKFIIAKLSSIGRSTVKHCHFAKAIIPAKELFRCLIPS